MLGSPRVTITPLFILAGSRAQLEMPMNATRSSLAMTYKNTAHGMYKKRQYKSSKGNVDNYLPVVTGQPLLFHPPAEDGGLSRASWASPQPNQLHPEPLLTHSLFCLASLGIYGQC